MSDDLDKVDQILIEKGDDSINLCTNAARTAICITSYCDRTDSVVMLAFGLDEIKRLMEFLNKNYGEKDD